MRSGFRVSCLLDACVYRDFAQVNRLSVLEAVLPKPCYTGPLQWKPNEIGEPFCERVGLRVPDVTAERLLEAQRQIRSVDSDWALSTADLSLLGYAVCTGYTLLTRDGPMRRCANHLGVTTWGTLELLDTGVQSGCCTRQDAIDVAQRLLNAKPPRRLPPDLIEEFIFRWK